MDRVIGKVLTKARARDRSRIWGSNRQSRQNETVKRLTIHCNKHLAMTGTYNQTHSKQALAIKARMRARLTNCLKKITGSKADNTDNLIQCSPIELVDHLRRQMPEFDTSCHHIDHIFPFNVFDNGDEMNQRRVMNWSNTQPLTQSENIQKGHRLPTKAMAAKVDPSCWPDGVTMEMLPDIYPGWATPLRMHAPA